MEQYNDITTVCTIEMYAAPLLLNDGVAIGGAKYSQGLMQSILPNEGKWKIPPVLVARSASLQRFDHLLACHLHLAPKCDAITHLCTTCLQSESNCKGHQMCVRSSLQEQWIAATVHVERKKPCNTLFRAQQCAKNAIFAKVLTNQLCLKYITRAIYTISASTGSQYRCSVQYQCN